MVDTSAAHKTASANNWTVIDPKENGDFVLPHVAHADIARIDVVDVDLLIQTKNGETYLLPRAGIDAMGDHPPHIQLAGQAVGADVLINEIGSKLSDATFLASLSGEASTTNPTNQQPQSPKVVKELQQKVTQQQHQIKVLQQKVADQQHAQQHSQEHAASQVQVNQTESVEKMTEIAKHITENLNTSIYDYQPPPEATPVAPASVPLGVPPPISLTPVVTLFMGNITDTTSSTSVGVTTFLGGGGATGTDASSHIGPLNQGQYSVTTITGTSGDDAIYAEGNVGNNGANASTYYAKEFQLNVAGYFTTLNNVVITGLPSYVSVYMNGAPITPNTDGSVTIPSSLVTTAGIFQFVYNATANTATGTFDMSINVSGETTHGKIFSTTQTVRFEFADITSTNQLTGNTYYYENNGVLTEIYLLPTGDNPNDIIAGDGNNTVVGGRSNDTITATNGNNSITAAGGNDVITVGTGNNTIVGSTGNDSIVAGIGGTGANLITFGNGNDTIQVGDGANTLSGGSGANSITAGNGANNITTGAGNDIISVGSGANTIHAGDGANLVTALGGNNAIYTGIGNDTITVGDGANLIVDNGGANSITFGNGNDTIQVGDGNSTLYGGSGTGNDSLTLGNGFYTVTLGNGNDSVVQTSGGGTYILGSGDDSITAGDGNYTITASVSGGDNINIGTGTETITLGNGNNHVVVGSGTNSITTGSGNDYLQAGNGTNFFHPGTGSDTIVGGASGSSTVDYTGVTAALTVSLVTGSVSGSGVAATMTNVANFTGGEGADTITGSTGNNLIHGGNGNDTIYGGGGNDTLYGDGGNDSLVGGTGVDVIYGGDGNDTIDGGSAGADTLYGGAGNDTFINPHAGQTYVGSDAATLPTGELNTVDYSTTATAVDVDLTVGLGYGGAADGSHFVMINEVIGSSGFDTLVGGLLNDYLSAGAGGASITGGGGNNTLVGGTSGNTYFYSSGNGNDTIIGGTGWDVLNYTLHTGTNSANVVNFTSSTHTFTYNGITYSVDPYSGTAYTGAHVDSSSSPFHNGDSHGDYYQTNTVTGATLIDQVAAYNSPIAFFNDNADNALIYTSSYNDTVIGGNANETVGGNMGGQDYFYLGGGTANQLNTSWGSTSEVIYLNSAIDINGNGVGDAVDHGITSMSALGLTFTGFRYTIGTGISAANFATSQFTSSQVALLEGVQQVLGSQASDLIVGDANANYIDGQGGNDTIYGEGGADSLYGGAGNDMFVETASQMSTVAQIYGGADTDTLQVTGGFTFSAGYFSSNSARFNTIEILDVRNSASGQSYSLSEADIQALATNGTASSVTLKLDHGDTFTPSATGSSSLSSTGATTFTANQSIEYKYYDASHNQIADLVVQAT